MNLKFYTKGYITLKNGKVDICDPCLDRNELFYKALFDVPIHPDRYKCFYCVDREAKNRSKEPVKTLVSIMIIASSEMERKQNTKLPHVKKKSIVKQFKKDKLFDLDWRKYGIIDSPSGIAGFWKDKPQCTENLWTELTDFMSEADKEAQAHIYRTNLFGFWAKKNKHNARYKILVYEKETDDDINTIVGLRIDRIDNISYQKGREI